MSSVLIDDHILGLALKMPMTVLSAKTRQGKQVYDGNRDQWTAIYWKVDLLNTHCIWAVRMLNRTDFCKKNITSIKLLYIIYAVRSNILQNEKYRNKTQL